MAKKIAVLPGDGIGPEIVAAARVVLDRVAALDSLELEYREALVGGAAYEASGSPLPEETLRICDDADAIFFGAVGGPQWEGLPPEQQPERGALLPLRKRYNLYVNIRPVLVYPSLVDASPLKKERLNVDGGGVDFVIMRELTGGLYFGQPKSIDREAGEALDTLRYNVTEIERIARTAFETARVRRKKVCSVDKANVLSSGILWRETVNRLHSSEYKDIELSHLYVDNASMQLILNPGQFDVILTENTFGDILSDEAATLPGSIGLLASASLNDTGFGLFEPCHGSGNYPPSIAGLNVANPVAQILSAAMMLRYALGCEGSARKIEAAVTKAITAGKFTRELGGSLSTAEVGQAVADLLA
ncbi:3-isopropylmalate dehydrogenase [Candidatus Haliotispira prima]|uniref:3-isopropylmalate dehydrogenase n=1 Tax=Candidatus Haliotispira prima TaxID=3034016 RepID=A0ABY8MG48_9SPIO|nr:3-isopropylmalate dehydrogenase [Candidatus Haliotispira prima]